MRNGTASVPDSSDLSDLITGASPHLHARGTADGIMRDVLIALLPAVLGSVYIFGTRVLPYYLLSVAVAMGTDFAWRRFVKKQEYRFDYTPVVTGVLLAMSMPGNVPLWLPAAGALIGIVVGKELFGGVGLNFFNPAVFGRGVLRVIFVSYMTQNIWPRPEVPYQQPLDAVSGATPLMVLKEGGVLDDGQVLSSLLGTVGGKIGETSAMLLLIGAAYLFARKIINGRIPAAMLGTIALIAWLFGGPAGFASGGWNTVIGHVLGGASILGAFFMATDYSSSPAAPLAQWLFGAGVGLSTMLFRFYSSYSEGFTFALLIMNLTVPLFDRYVRPRVLGEESHWYRK